MPVWWGQVCDEMTFLSTLVVVAAVLILVVFTTLVAVFTAALAAVLGFLVLFVFHNFTPFLNENALVFYTVERKV